MASESGSEDADRLEVLVVLAQDYQRTHHPVGPPDMQSVIELEMDRRGLTRPGGAVRQDVTANDREAAGGLNAGRRAETSRPSKTCSVSDPDLVG